MDESGIARRTTELLATNTLPYYVHRSNDAGLTQCDLITLDLPSGFDSSLGSFDPANPEATELRVNGSLDLDATSSVRGDVVATGTLVSGNPTAISGTLTENAATTSRADISEVWQQHLDESNLRRIDIRAVASPTGAPALRRGRRHVQRQLRRAQRLPADLDRLRWDAEAAGL